MHLSELLIWHVTVKGISHLHLDRGGEDSWEPLLTGKNLPHLILHDNDIKISRDRDIKVLVKFYLSDERL